MKRIRHTGMQAARLACLMLIIGMVLAWVPSSTVKADEFGDYPTKHSTGGTPGSMHEAGDKPETVVNELNEYLMSIVMVAGIIVIVLGVIKLIMALSDHAPMGKLNSTTMISLGLVMIGGSTILDGLAKASTATDAKSQVQPVLDMIGQGFLWPGIILAAIGVFKCVLSIMNERPEEKVEGGKMAIIGAVLASSSVVINAIADLVIDSSGDMTTKANNVGSYIINDIIVPVAMLIGGVILAFGLFNFAQSFKDEDSSGKSRAGIQLVVGLLMVSAGTVVKMFVSDAGTTSAKDIVETIIAVTKYAGIVLGGILLLVGGLQFGVAYKDDNSEAKTRASHVLTTGVILLGVGGLIATVVEGMIF